jgi:5-methylcytosine-specific restriction endonuclease McrA
MRYIQKQPIPQFFIDDTKTLQAKLISLANKKDKKLVWDNEYKEKRKLKLYILENEQNYLCCYCEAKVTLDDSHIEHIKPKDMDEESLTFDYANLAVSCDGICFNDKNERLTCGHKKDNKFDETKFFRSYPSRRYSFLFHLYR